MSGSTIHDPKDKQLALDFAYMYGYPLIEYGKFVAQMPNPTTNKLSHGRRLSTSKDRQVIRPNSDTLYTTIFMDLSSHDIQIEIPKIEERYWCYSFYDMYGNDIANISSLQGHRPGKWLIRFSDTEFGLHIGLPLGADYEGYASLPTPYGMSIARFATDQSISDQSLVNKYQNQIRLVCIPRTKSVAPPFQLSIFTAPENSASEEVSVADAVMRLTAKLAPHNLSPILEDRKWISLALKRSGMENGVFNCFNGADISHVCDTAEKKAQALLDAAGGSLNHGNGWSSAYPEYLGNFGSHYAARYSIAKRGYLALTSDQAIYPSLSRALKLKPDEAVLLRFSRKPVLVKTGFWSLTAYDAEQYLVPNGINRYCLGDRDNMTFPDGTSLSEKGKDGEFFILMQPADIEPPNKWRNNWLPSPAGGGKMSITLRWYGAKKEMMTKAYEYPRLEFMKAIPGPTKSML
ncbi:unnamed protein product [Penicillium manginii]